MNPAQRRLAAKSIAALNDQASIETRPLQDIKVDLAELGIDPQASIDAARNLAVTRLTPANRLLIRLDDADEVDQDIEALENADIDDIRIRLASGSVTSATPKARPQPAPPSNITPLKPRGRRFLGWGGSIVGIAACLLIFVLTRPDQLYQTQRPVIEEADLAKVDDASVIPEMAMDEATDEAVTDETVTDETVNEAAGLDLALEAPPQTRARYQTETLNRTVPSAEPPKRTEPVQSAALAELSAPEADIASERLGDEVGEVPADVTHRPKARPVLTAKEPPKARDLPNDQKNTVIAAAPVPAAKAFHKPVARPAPPPANPESAGVVASLRTSDAIQPALDELEAGLLQKSTSSPAPNNPEAVLIVKADSAPVELKVKARTLPTGDLIDRLEEARALLGSRPVVALVTFLKNGKKVDAAITVREPASLTEVGNAFAVASLSASNEQDAFELITLPDKP